MTLPPSSFAREFRAHVVPKLTLACELQGLFVALRLASVTEAHAEVMGIACEHDAGRLPEEHFDHLESWAMDTLLARATVKRAEIEARAARLAHVAEDIQRWSEAVQFAQ